MVFFHLIADNQLKIMVRFIKIQLEYSLVQTMSFSNLLKVKSNISFPKQQDYQNNPIHRINLGLKKGKYYRNNQNDPLIANRKMQSNKHEKQKNLSFRSLSKKKEECLQSITRQKTQVHSECFSRQNSSDKNLFKQNNIQRKLNFNGLNRKQSSSKEKKLNFGQIIKNSKEKRLQEKSKTKNQVKKIIQPPFQQNSNFTKLKNRLINERSTLDTNYQRGRKETLLNQVQQFDRVRISIQVEQTPRNQDELDMNPIF